jgi:replicative DNA helicase
MIVDKLFKQIEDGKSGKNIGISMGLPDIDRVLYGIQRRYIYTVGADTSGGKTSFGLDIFVYNLIKNARNRKINILYYSFEMASEILYAKLLSRYIYDEYYMVITFEEILSLSKPISDEKLEVVSKCLDWLNKLENILTIYDKPLNPNHIYGTLKDWLKNFGTFIPINEHREDYIENDPEEYKVAIIDHMG